MNESERAAAIAAHLAAHEAKLAKRKAARLAKDRRNKDRGLRAAVESLKLSTRRAEP